MILAKRMGKQRLNLLLEGLLELDPADLEGLLGEVAFLRELILEFARRSRPNSTLWNLRDQALR